MSRLRARSRRARSRSSSPTQRYRGFSRSSRRARSSSPSRRARPAWTTSIREDSGSSRAASAARKGSFTGRMWHSRLTSKTSSRGSGAGSGASADWWMTCAFARHSGASLSSAFAWSTTSRSAARTDPRASGDSSRSRYRSVPVRATTSGQPGLFFCHRRTEPALRRAWSAASRSGSRPPNGGSSASSASGAYRFRIAVWCPRDRRWEAHRREVTSFPVREFRGFGLTRRILNSYRLSLSSVPLRQLLAHVRNPDHTSRRSGV